MMMLAIITNRARTRMSTTPEGLNEVEKSRKYLVEHYSTLIGKHGDEFVAIVDGNLVFSDQNLDSLLSNVKREFGSTERALIEYIPSKHLHVIV